MHAPLNDHHNNCGDKQIPFQKLPSAGPYGQLNPVFNFRTTPGRMMGWGLLYSTAPHVRPVRKQTSAQSRISPPCAPALNSRRRCPCVHHLPCTAPQVTTPREPRLQRHLSKAELQVTLGLSSHSSKGLLGNTGSIRSRECWQRWPTS